VAAVAHFHATERHPWIVTGQRFSSRQRETERPNTRAGSFSIGSAQQ
jgi:hypothetical protein